MNNREWHKSVKPGDLVVPCEELAGKPIPQKVVGVLNDKAYPDRSMICVVSSSGDRVWSSSRWFMPHETAQETAQIL